MKTKRAILMIAVVGVLAIVASQACATVVVDLRFSDGTVEKQLSAGNGTNQDYNIDVWVQVTGTNSSLADGLAYINYAIQSMQIDGGLLLGGTGVGVTSYAMNSTWTNMGTQNGAESNLTVDSIADWGNPASSGSTITPQSPSTGVSLYASNISDESLWNAITNGTEFKVGTAVFHVGNLVAAPSASTITDVVAVKPTWTTVNPKFMLTHPDTVLDNNKAHYTVGDGVSFTYLVPEPGTMTLLVMGGLALIARRRRSA